MLCFARGEKSIENVWTIKGKPVSEDNVQAMVRTEDVLVVKTVLVCFNIVRLGRNMCIQQNITRRIEDNIRHKLRGIETNFQNMHSSRRRSHEICTR